MPVAFTAIYQVGAAMAADIFDYHAGWVDRLAGETLPTYTGPDFFMMTLREPVGVVAAIIPWNAPLMLFAQKVAPGAGRRVHGGAEAVRVRVAHRAAAGAAVRVGRRASRRVEPRDGHRARHR